MPPKPKRSPVKKVGPTLQAIPERVLEGEPILLRGSGWEDRSTTVTLDGEAAKIERILQGHPVPGGVRPDGTGMFVVRIATYGLKPGRYELRVSAGRRTQAVVRIELLRRTRPSAKDAEGDVNLGYWRSLAAFERRFAHIGYIPAGVRLAQARSIQALRRALTPRRPEDTVPRGADRPDIPFFTRPVPGGCNWTPLGPAPIVAGSATSSFPGESGRVRSIAIDLTVPSRIYLGTANAGVWKSEDSGFTWSPKTDDQPSLAIGALAIDANAPKRVFAGTGEYHQGFLVNAYYGLGLLYSEDFGETWTPLAAATFERVEISRILFDPNNTAKHMFLSCNAGVYESLTGGTSWVLLRAGSASDLVLRVIGGTLQLIAAFHSEGIFTSSLTGGVWSAWTQITSPAFPVSFGRIALGQSRNNPDHIWAAFGSVSGYPPLPLVGLAKSITGGGAWTAVGLTGLPLNEIYQINYNLFVAVHPDTPKTVFLGTNRLFRTDTGDAPWTEVSGGPIILHLDHHAFAFDPVNPSVVYDCNDGGVYRADDGGTIWEQRNRDLSTLQFYHITNHPQWPAVLLGGTQDNGGVFYTAAPAWKRRPWPPGIPVNPLDGDIVATAIEPLVPSRMYRGSSGEIRRSDNGGRTWSAPKYTFSGSYEWNFPFVVDPAIAGVCYTGGNALVRSDTAGDTWTTITPALTGNITTIAVHPADSNLVYIGTSQGRVYRVQRTGADWTLPNVTTTDITAPPLPAGLYISCLAVDTAGTVWVSFSSILMTEDTGEFTNDHVYRLPAGSSTWENRSAGLAQANPINTIAIDPKDNTVVFCGGDVGVFRWNAASNAWQLWDHGLPNAPVFHLAVHNPSRLLRAATFGRGVWERPIDATICPDVDIYMRDNILDTGRGPAPSGVPNPFDPGNLVWWFQSEDIKVDAPLFQTPMPVTDHVALANRIEHRNPRRGMTNRFYVQVHNRGPFKATNVRVRAFFADTSLGLPNLPADFWAAGKPFDADPSAVSWAPVGPTQLIPELEPGETAVVSWDWMVPVSAAENSCLLALATCTEDPLSAMGVLYVHQLVTEQNNVTLKNLVVVR